MNKELVEHYMDQWGFGKRHYTLEKSDLTGINKDILYQADMFIEKYPNNTPEGLYICGETNGSGKTSLSAYIIKQLMYKRKIKLAMFIPASELMEAIYRNYSGDNNNILEKAMGIEILVLDDLGKEKTSAHTCNKMYNLFNKRYNNIAPTIITSNYTINNLKLLEKDEDDVARALRARLEESTTTIEVT